MPGILQQQNEIEKLKYEYKRLAENAFSPLKEKTNLPEVEALVLEEC